MLVTKREALPSLLTCSVLFSSNKNLLPVCCRVAGLVYTAALFALSSPCFWKGWKSSFLFPAKATGDTHALIYTHYAHTHCHVAQNSVSWRLPVAGRFSLPLFLSLCVSTSPALLLFPRSSLSNTYLSLCSRLERINYPFICFIFLFCSFREGGGVIFRL